MYVSIIILFQQVSVEWREGRNFLEKRKDVVEKFWLFNFFLVRTYFFVLTQKSNKKSQGIREKAKISLVTLQRRKLTMEQ